MKLDQQRGELDKRSCLFKGARDKWSGELGQRHGMQCEEAPARAPMVGERCRLGEAEWLRRVVRHGGASGSGGGVVRLPFVRVEM
jgi:hypothetical protein